MQRVEEERGGGGGGGGTTRAPRAVPGAAVLLLSPAEPPRGSRHASLDSTAETQVCPTGELPSAQPAPCLPHGSLQPCHKSFVQQRLPALSCFSRSPGRPPGWERDPKDPKDHQLR